MKWIELLLRQIWGNLFVLVFKNQRASRKKSRVVWEFQAQYHGHSSNNLGLVPSFLNCLFVKKRHGLGIEGGSKCPTKLQTNCASIATFNPTQYMMVFFFSYISSRFATHGISSTPTCPTLLDGHKYLQLWCFYGINCWFRPCWTLQSCKRKMSSWTSCTIASIHIWHSCDPYMLKEPIFN